MPTSRATLKDGVLTISHFKGGLYGGSLDLSGVVNGSQPALAIDLKGDASGIQLGEMLRSTSRQQPVRRHGQGHRSTAQLNATGITRARPAARPPTSSGARWRAARSSAATSSSAPTRR